VLGEGGEGAGEDAISYSRFLLIFASSVPLRVPRVLTIFTNDGSISVKNDSEVLEHQHHYNHYQQPRMHKNTVNTNIIKPITRINKRVSSTTRKTPTITNGDKTRELCGCVPVGLKGNISNRRPSSFLPKYNRASWTDCEHLLKCFTISIINLYHIQRDFYPYSSIPRMKYNHITISMHYMYFSVSSMLILNTCDRH